MKRKRKFVLALSVIMLLSSCSTSPVTVMRNMQKSFLAAGTNATVTTLQAQKEEDSSTYNDGTGKSQTSTNGSITVSNSVPKNSFPSEQQVNVTQEIVLTSTVEYRTPYTEAALQAVFTGPNGQTMCVPGFWDGEQTWKIRFAAPDEGVWNYETVCSNTADTGLHGQKGQLIANAYTGDNELIRRGRLRVSDDKTYLTYGDGTPFFWMADTHWYAFSQRMKLNFSNNKNYKSMFKGTIDQRAEEGYTAFQAVLNVANNWEALGLHNEGGMQWLDGALWETPNPGFWQNVDERLEYIVSKGMTPVVAFGWSGELTTGNMENYKRIVRYVVARYASYPIVWNMSGEYNANGSIENDLDNYGRLGQYVSDIDAYHTLETIHASYNVVDDWEHPQYTSDYFRGQEWMDFVMSEGGHYTHFDTPVYSDWNVYNERDYKIPWLESEAKYEDIWEIPTEQTREIAYLAVMNGSFGYSYGAEGGWQDTWNSQDTFQTYGRLPTPWHKALNKVVGSKQLPLFKAFFTSLPWWEMELDTTSVKWSKEREDEGILRPTVNTSADKRYITIYYPINNRNINYDVYPEATGTLTGLNPKLTYTAKWFDTQTGTYTLISDSIRAAADGTYTLPWPENLDTNDCVFVMTANNNLDIGVKYYQAAKSERNKLVLPMVTGEQELPKMSIQDKNAVLIDLGKARGKQGQDNLYYYSYNRITEEFTELPMVQLPYWGEFTWQATTYEFITDNMFCGGPKNGVSITWVAPEDGKLEIISRPQWKQMYQGSEGAIVTYMQNDEVLTEFAFDGENYVEDQFITTLQVKKGDRISIMNRYNKAFNITGNQVDLNTNMYFSANNG